MKKAILITVLLGLAVTGGLYYFFIYSKNLNGQIVIPYIAHQKPRIDPHVPSAVPISDKMDEVLFDGLFNISANSSGKLYEDGLGEYMGIDANSTVRIRLKPSKKWHSSFRATMEKEKVTVSEAQAVTVTAEDLRFTLRRIQSLGSISPDYILVSQAVPEFDFTGPDDNNEISFQFRGDREWIETDIKEILSFKVLPGSSEMNAPNYLTGSGPYLYAAESEDQLFFHKTLDGTAAIPSLHLKPFIDNSTYSTELKNKNINTILSTPFGSISPIVEDSSKFFYKSSISTCFFGILFNTTRLSLEQRLALRSLFNNRAILTRFFRLGTEQQRHLANYRGAGDNYDEYLNYSVFPSSSYYIADEIVIPLKEHAQADLSVLPDTIRIQTCLNADFKEELAELAEILNDPSVTRGKVTVQAVQNEEIGQGNYDAVLVPFSGYRSNFLFDLYNIFLREPDFKNYKINLQTAFDNKGKQTVADNSFSAAKNFFRIDLTQATAEQEDLRQLLSHIYNFMSTREIGDKQVYAQFIDQLDQKLALGSWLFSLPSLAYFSNQFDENTIDLYGKVSQLSTIEKWQERSK